MGLLYPETLYMASQSIIGTCKICGESGRLSKEHVPRKQRSTIGRSFLRPPTTIGTEGNLGEGSEGRTSSGHHVYTLCVKCNNTTGGLYGPHFVEWCREGMDFLDKTGGKGSVLHFGRVRPLPIIKQITTMFLASTVRATRSRGNDRWCGSL